MYFLRAFVFLLCSLPYSIINAQTAGITHVITPQLGAKPQLGRDLWFAPIQNDSNRKGKYIELYVTSPTAAKINVSMTGQSTKVLSVAPLSVASFSIPLSWEIQSSGTTTFNAIHVWSNDGDISAYVMSHNGNASEGMWIVPAIGWDTDYVVAAYNGLFNGFNVPVPDAPSEFIIVANQDNTTLTITPSADIREEGTTGACCDCVLHQAGVKFTEALNRGQAIQYKTTCVKNAEDFDFTGTVIHSNKPIGVVGGSVCTNVPMDFPTANHLCDMMPPVEKWGNEYYTAPFYPTQPGKDWSSILIIGSKPAQMIFRTDPSGGKSVYCVLGPAYDHFLRPDIDQQAEWSSDAPFYLVQYINSSTYPDGDTTVGNPAEVIVPPVSAYAKKVVFQVAPTQGNETPYNNYVNVITLASAMATTTFDGIQLSKLQHMAQYMAIDGIYNIARIANVKPGTHVVQSDSGAGVYAYGYGENESYAWTGHYNCSTTNSPDTVAPAATASGTIRSATIHLVDSGYQQSGLNFIRLDTAYNMTVTFDPTWVEGAARSSCNYVMHVLDSSKSAYLQVSVFDKAGNGATIQSTFRSAFASIIPPYRKVGVGDTTGARPIVFYDTLVSSGNAIYTIQSLSLAQGKGASGFNIDSAVTTPLPLGERRAIKLSFIPYKSGPVSDTLVLSNGDISTQAIVAGSGSQPDYRLHAYSFGSVAVNDGGQGKPVIENLSGDTITIARVWADSTLFFFNGSTPFTILPLSTFSVPFNVTADRAGVITSAWHANSTSLDGNGQPLGIRTDTLSVNGIPFSDVELSSSISDQAHIDIADKQMRIALPSNWCGMAQLKLDDVRGTTVFTVPFAAHSLSLVDVGTLSSGVYFYQLTCGKNVAKGKIVITGY